MSEHVGLRGRTWFQVLTEKNQPASGDPGTVLATEAQIGGQTALFLCVVPDASSRFPCVRDGQVGLEGRLPWLTIFAASLPKIAKSRRRKSARSLQSLM